MLAGSEARIDPGSSEDPGVAGYLTKPIDFEALFVRIGELTGG